MRGRPPFIGGNPTPPTPFDSSDASPAKPKPTLLKQKVQSVYTPKIQSHSNEFKSWEEFLKAYGQGHFSNEQPRPQPCSRLGSDFPPFPAYVEDTGITNPPPFLAAPIPPTEEKRLKALYSLQILGTGTDVNFQRVARLVATILGVERCMICLVDRDQISVKATHRTGNMGCPRELSLSGHAVLRHPSDPLVVLDASQDWRFKSLPTVTGDPKVRFYAGAALATSDGLNIGTLCVIDSRPRTEFPETEKMLLVDFASVVMREMELWNDQVQLCTRTRMMRDITSWVRGCLDMPGNQSTFPAPAGSGSSSSTETTHSGLFQPRASPVTDGVTTTTISDTPAVVAGPMSAGPGSATYIAPPSDQVLPTPTGSPTLFSNALGSRSSQDPVPKPSGGRLQDVAFPSACNMIQATMNVDAEPWAYFVVLSSSHTKQFSVHERIYLKNFGSCLVTEVLKRRVEAADKAKGVFIKSISHELRTPLHIILGILELLYTNADETLNEHQLSLIASAEASGKILIDTINNIIDLADLDPDNSADLDCSEPSMEGSANGDASSIDSYETYSSAGLRQEQKIGLELMVAMDEPEKGPDQEAHWNFMLNVPVVKRILTQLLENALKFTTTGFVEISAVSPPLATFPLKPPLADSRPVLFTVRDTGKGISPEYVDRQLFQRFSQEDPLQAGTGLGLALVKLLVESLGGWLEIWSEGIEGKGCVARVLIWAKPSPNVTKSLRDEEGVWQERSCRFYTGDATVSTDRLWKIMGERIMGQDLNMNDLNDQSRCELLIFNDDLPRLKAYLSHWADQHAVSQIQGVGSSLEPVPLLMLTSISSEKKARNLVEAYKRSWYGSGRLDCPTRVPQRSIRNFVSQRQGPSKANVKKQGSKEETSTGNPTNVLRQSLAPEGTDQLGVLKPVPRVLIVEDNMTNRMILRTFLKKRGVSVVEAENGKLGVERFQEEVWRRQGRSGFEFVLMDLQMPVMDGNLATKRIRDMEGSRGAGGTNVLPDTERRGYRHSTIFALTGLAGEEDKQLAFECGVDGYLTKPVSLTVMTTHILCLVTTEMAPPTCQV
ncbi:hypothetical protein EDD21DRAFT_301983 [Dissophora ornata]|nr:hypothetical protein EDD21DRAFT_301983 [Dissophora ornata]